MNTHTEEFQDTQAARAEVPLLIGLMGPSGGGKTFSALRLATGIQRVAGGDIGFIDTESRRALSYADRFKFRHLDFKAPFGPLRYLAAVEHFQKKGIKTLIVDSMSHEHDGPGGVLEMHEELMGGDHKKSFQAWMKPKSERRRFINTILQMQMHFIFCFRAKEKMKPVPGSQPKELGFMPIAGEEFVYEMTANCLLLPNSGGIPTWESNMLGEKQMMKKPEQFAALLNERKPIDEMLGQRFAEWARGGVPVADSEPATWADWTNEERATFKARQGLSALSAWFKSLPADQQEAIKPRMSTEFKPIAIEADKKAA